MHRSILAAAALSFAIAGAAHAACPTDPYDYGNGNDYAPCNATVSTQGGVELSLRGHVRGDVAPAPNGITYLIPTGVDGSVDFGVNTFGTVDFADFDSLLLTIHDYANNHTQSFDIRAIPDNPFVNPNFLDNSEALKFSFMDSRYNKFQNNTFGVTLSSTGAGDPRSLRINLQQGEGFGGTVPEPATWALLIAGFGGAGAMLRRKRMVVA